jgi:hypothetical protein
MKRFLILSSLVTALIASLACLLWMIVDDLSHPERWGVIGYRDPRLYVPVVVAMALVPVWVVVRGWLNGRRATPAGKPNRSGTTVEVNTCSSECS